MNNFRIYKYRLEVIDEQTVNIKGLVKVLSTGLDPSGELCLWAIVDIENGVSCAVLVQIIGTGNPIERNLVVNSFLGSVTQGVFVWHVFVTT